MNEYVFRPLVHEDLPMLFEWMSKPHVRKWWDTEDNWKDFERRYSLNIEDPDVFPHIISLTGRPIGYINYWYVKDDPNFCTLYPPSTIGTDQLIGAEDLLGLGHGSAFIRQFTDSLLMREDIPLIITDPHPDNTAAVRAYEKAGFKAIRNLDTDEGSVLLMEKASPL